MFYKGENFSIDNGTLTFLDWEYDGIHATLYTRYQSDILIAEGCYTFFWMASECSVKVGTNLKATFDDLAGTLRIGSYLSGDDMYLRYDCEEDCWVEGFYNSFVRIN